MTKNPYVRALLATVYIVFVSLLMFYGPKLTGAVDRVDTILAPIAMISLFTLSAAVMGFLFVFEPLQMYLSGQKKEAVQFFLKTTITFAVVTFILLIVAFSGVL